MGKGMFWVVVLLAILGTCCCQWGCPPHERSALIHFKHQLLDPYDHLASWKGLYCCSWKGIACNRRTGHVVRVDLYRLVVKNSSSQIFPALFQLQHLEYLDLSVNDFYPLPIPSQLPSLSRLRHLSLIQCGFTGRIPSELGKMSGLKFLDISENFALSGPIPSEIGNMSSLKFLDISGNEALSGPIPSEIGNMSSLKFLDISYNYNLEMRQSSSWIQNLRGLEHLGLAYVNLTSAVVENVASLPNLTSLEMSKLPGTILSPLVNLTSLSYLGLDGSYLTQQQPFPIWISNLTSLVSLSLEECHLHDSIPSTVLSLAHLRDLRLYFNPDLKVNLSFIAQHAFQLSILDIYSSNVGGVIPSSIGNMSSLTDLRLLNSNIEGTFPNFIGNLSRLERLSLSGNSLRGSIPWSSLGGLSKLSSLQLRSNQLNGSLPSTFGNLSSLVCLDLSNNSLSGTFLLSQLENFTKIYYLALSHNLLRVKVEGSWIPKFQLWALYLSSCNIDGDFPAFISTQYTIQELDLSNNSLSGDIPDWLWDLQPFYTLNLSCNQFGGRPLTSKFSKFSAQNVDLHRNKLQGNVFAPHPNVEFLDMSENQFDGIIPANINEKYSQSQLNYLSLANNTISGAFPHSICEGHNLEVLDVSNNKLTGNIFASFGNCSSTLKVLNLENNSLEGEIRSMVCLQTLKLGGNRLQGPIPSSLKNCTSLEILDLGYNNMQGIIPSWIGNLIGLRILVLRYNKFKGGIPLQLTKLQKLQVLILSNNNLSGAIPSSLRNLRAMANQTQSPEVLQYSNSSLVPYLDKMEIINKGQFLEYVRSLALVHCLDLSNNNFSGDIPKDIGFLIGLMILNLSGDHLNGKVPTSFGNLVRLESLDLSRNNLIGNIPQELQSLTFLSYLNMSCNNFSGRIPQGGQMFSFGERSFSNNGDLCGLQVNINCSSSPSSNNTYDEDVSEQEWEEHVWWEVGIGLSIGFGFSIVIGVLCFNKKCRTRCFKVMDDIIVILDQTVREKIF